MKEIWKPIPGYEKTYAVSNLGRVKSRRRFGTHGGILQLRTREKYQIIGLHKNKKQHFHFVHRLVLLAFIGPCPPGMECRHFPDRDPTNNRLDNLSWATKSRNAKDRKIHGTKPNGAKLTNEDIPIIRKRLAKGETQMKIALDYRVSRSAISQISINKNWKGA